MLNPSFLGEYLEYTQSCSSICLRKKNITVSTKYSVTSVTFFFLQILVRYTVCWTPWLYIQLTIRLQLYFSRRSIYSLELSPQKIYGKLRRAEHWYLKPQKKHLTNHGIAGCCGQTPLIHKTHDCNNFIKRLLIF